MLSKSIATALLATALSTGVGYAQGNKPDTVKTDGMHKDGAWRASKLVGVNVYNDANEKIGDISDVILDTSGRVTNVVLGVGGFLGMGEHYVAVGYDKLKWVSEPVRSTTVSTNDQTARPATNVDDPAGKRADGTPRTTTGTATTIRSSDNWYPDHVVLNATKDELKTLPEFKY